MRIISNMKVNLFVTCLVDIFYPQVGLRLAALLERLGYELHFPRGQTCCGQPAMNCGYHGQAKLPAEQFLKTFAQTEGPIVAPYGSCVHMVKHGYPRLFEDSPELLAQAVEIGARTYDFCSFIVNVAGRSSVGGSLPNGDGPRVVYHDECHLMRGLNVREEPRSLLMGVEGCELLELEGDELCCGFGGAFSLKLPQVSVAMADEKIDRYLRAGADGVVTTDVGCMMHLQGRIQRRGLTLATHHLLDLLQPEVQQ